MKPKRYNLGAPRSSSCPHVNEIIEAELAQQIMLVEEAIRCVSKST